MLLTFLQDLIPLLTRTFKLDRGTRNLKLTLDLKDQSLLRKLQLQPVQPSPTHHPY
ncbi:hypothetical protein M422DRAFT_28268 [Sphaerobolus stellatus SS14]|uniref:Uncharacterized protein n=1 Tax=Sphaerobolus stellatus (strain SS14) TaxID=990650 RepID=A0A0C9U4T4_SPHS4|nr:hypothetical protein M422DRAFT_33537 [Sphaerobolus stellatus SS14]KIJ48896.1 hypothetical protein M422DRAFT_28268 [Sphaerobolus stellatus SS14]